MDRQDFMDIVYSELESDPDNNRANRIIEAADGYAERRVDDALQVIKEQQSVKLGTNLAEVGTRAVRGYPIDADMLMEKVAEEYGERARDRLYQIIRYMPPAQPKPCEDAVSRKAAIEQMQGLPKWNGIIADSCVDFDDVINVLEDKGKLPSVTPKQRTGHWIPVGVAEVVGGESAQWGSAIAYHKCSVCDGQALRDDFEEEVLSDFCPHCGVKMEGAGE